MFSFCLVFAQCEDEVHFPSNIHGDAGSAGAGGQPGLGARPPCEEGPRGIGHVGRLLPGHRRCGECGEGKASWSPWDFHRCHQQHG